MVIIKNIPQQTCDLYNDNEFIGTINENQFHDVRVQIMESGLSGYYVIFNINGVEKRAELYPDGGCNLSVGMFDFNENCWDKLIGL